MDLDINFGPLQDILDAITGTSDVGFFRDDIKDAADKLTSQLAQLRVGDSAILRVHGGPQHADGDVGDLIRAAGGMNND